MKRYGPLIAVPDALAVGDPGRNHLRLTPDAVILREGVRLPGLVGTIVLGALTAVALSDLGVDPDDGALTLTVDGEEQVMPLSRHHVGGYWAPTVDGAHRLLAHLIANPEQRALLAHPEPLIDIAAQLARESV
ncbi:hypothetical protein [Microbacterium sp. TPD7012]|uniref:hypothetical protein n=1 Tax=Microbacterium sp. TPD7012 TaxID=2171975 RepID=UPI000D512432|nr:hypothetical protein [Microbacterium sp. TPD7012]PVE95757.1 hypothetical protein DC434_09510 [Microbacterium sp. TPD7012]